MIFLTHDLYSLFIFICTVYKKNYKQRIPYTIPNWCETKATPCHIGCVKVEIWFVFVRKKGFNP